MISFNDVEFSLISGPESLNDWTIDSKSTIKDALLKLNSSGKRFLVVLGLNGLVNGVLTDGDLRRGIVRGDVLDGPVSSIMNCDPILVQEGNLPSFTSSRSLTDFPIPIVNKSGSLVAIAVPNWTNIPDKKNEIFLIMAGGRGLRLGALTANTPKPMVPLAGVPMIERLILKAKSSGFYEFVISIHYLGKRIVDYLGDGARLGVQISYIWEDKPLGTAGCLYHLRATERTLVVANTDVVTDFDLDEALSFHKAHHSDATMCLAMVERQEPFGVVELDGTKINSILEKPTYVYFVNSGISIIGPKILKLMDKPVAIDMPDLLIRAMKLDLSVHGFPFSNKWIDVGRPNDLADLNSFLSNIDDK